MDNGSRIRQLRALSGWSQTQLAQATKKKTSTISAMENGNRQITLADVDELAVVFSEPLGWSAQDIVLYIHGLADIRPTGTGFELAPSEAGLESQMLRDDRPPLAAVR